ncbi:MAG: hypothetical protein AAF604_23325 [Acidobacteriota bacterium]
MTKLPMPSREWRLLLVGLGLLSLFCYFFSAVFQVFPWAVGRFLFYFFGPTLYLSAQAARALLLEDGERPSIDLGLRMTGLSGLIVSLMAVIQDTNFTVMQERLGRAETEAERELLTQTLWGVNNVQIALDIAFDVWISTGCVLLAVGLWRHLGARFIGALGIAAAGMALGLNLATLPTPPAEAGLFDGGPAVATWLGVVLFLTASPALRARWAR